MLSLCLCATETLAELAWRYGEQGVPHRSNGPFATHLIFPDGSAIDYYRVHTPRSMRLFCEEVFAEFCPTCNRLSDRVLVTRTGSEVVEVIRCRYCGDSLPLEKRGD